MKDSRVRLLSRIHRWLYRVSGGTVGRRLVGNGMLLLETTGRSSGRPHVVPLLYLEESPASVIVVASYGGRPDHPEWYRNLAKDPAVTVQIGWRRKRGIAETLNGADRDTWWSRAVNAYDGYLAYQERTDRQIPLVRIEMT